MNARRLTLATVVVAILVLAAVLVIPRLTSKGTQPTATGNAATVLDYSGQPTLGQANAPVTIALFEDFLCPHCAEFSDQVWPQVKRDFIDTGKAKAVFFYYPVISQTQSPVIGGMAQCVYMQSNDDFWKLEQILMRAQAELGNTPRAIQIATTYAPNLDAKQLTQCVDNGTGVKTVTKDTAIAQQLGLQGTPSILVDGKLVSNASWATVQKAIQAAIPAGKG